MSQTYEDPASAGELVKMLTTRSALNLLNESERAAIVRYQKAVAEGGWAEEFRTPDDDLIRELELVHAAQEDESLSRALLMRRPGASGGAARAQTGMVLLSPADRLLAGCNAHVTAAPFSLGDPLVEEVGNEVTFIGDQFFAASLPGSTLPAIEDLRTYSQLAIPQDGEVSVGVGLGSFATIGGRTLHRPSVEVPQVFPVRGGLLEATQARASLGHYLACLPGAPLRVATEVEVAVNIAVGDPARPFYLVIPPQSGPPILQAFGVAKLNLLSSSGDEANAQAKFLEHREGALRTFGTPVALHDLSVSQRLTVQPGTSWVYVGIEILLEVQRWFIVPPPPFEDRAGFAMIDLRSPGLGTHDIHWVLGAGGPVRIPRIAIALCPQQVVARTLLANQR